MAEKPTAAFVLSLIGGIFIILGGIGVAILGAIFNSLSSIVGFGNFGLGVEAFGLLGAVLGLIVIVAGVMLYVKPEQHIVWGAIVVILAIVSIPPTIAGLFIGFILALIGGILGLVFKPSMPMAAPYAPPPMAPPPQ